MALQVLVLGIIIGANNFAAALALGALGQAVRRGRILLMFAIFEFSIPLLGLWFGQRASGLVADQIGWLGPLLMAGLGIWTLYEAFGRSRDPQSLARWLSSWGGLIVLSAGLSLDNLIIGFSLGLSEVPALATASLIMVCSVTFAWIGLHAGARGRLNFERPAEAASGVLLIAIAWMDWSGWL